MPGTTLRDDILAIPGIDNAELDGDGSTPDGVRVRLAFGADPKRVGREVRRVLALHGMRSQLTDVPDHVAPVEPPPPPVPEVGTVVNLADYEQDEPVADESEAEVPVSADEPSSDDSVSGEPILEDVTSDEPMADEPVTDEPVAVEPAPHESAPTDDTVVDLTDDEHPVAEEALRESADEAAFEPEPLLDESAVAATPAWEAPAATVSDDHPREAGREQQKPAQGFAELGNVAVIEGATGVTVTVSSLLGKTASRTAPSHAGGVDRAVVSAVSRLLVPDQDPPLLVEVMGTDRDGEQIVTVVLELDDGRHVVGSALLAANRSWALARATRAALAVPG